MMTRDFFDPSPEEQKVVLIDADTVGKRKNSSNPVSTAIPKATKRCFCGIVSGKQENSHEANHITHPTVHRPRRLFGVG
jgi:hypothetical protein